MVRLRGLRSEIRGMQYLSIRYTGGLGVRPSFLVFLRLANAFRDYADG